ncbi:MAG: hypothetical protein KAR06_00200 [Deltaproteobacteria bacterium]|nr:hypothetical protein [Deltaproteobacteria bacterium]
MTVKELIEQLKGCNLDAVVKVNALCRHYDFSMAYGGLGDSDEPVYTADYTEVIFYVDELCTNEAIQRQEEG